MSLSTRAPFIVTEANAVIRPIHDRMPVILRAEDFTAWLDPNNRDRARLTGLPGPDDPEHWTLDLVSKRVNSPRNEGQDLLDRMNGNAA